MMVAPLENLALRIEVSEGSLRAREVMRETRDCIVGNLRVYFSGPSQRVGWGIGARFWPRLKPLSS
jgi:hypothetical protein